MWQGNIRYGPASKPEDGDSRDHRKSSYAIGSAAMKKAAKK